MWNCVWRQERQERQEQVADAIMATDHVSVHVVEKRDRYIMRLRCMASHRPRSVRFEKKVQCGKSACRYNDCVTSLVIRSGYRQTRY